MKNKSGTSASGVQVASEAFWHPDYWYLGSVLSVCSGPGALLLAEVRHFQVYHDSDDYYTSATLVTDLQKCTIVGCLRFV